MGGGRGAFEAVKKTLPILHIPPARLDVWYMNDEAASKIPCLIAKFAKSDVTHVDAWFAVMYTVTPPRNGHDQKRRNY